MLVLAGAAGTALAAALLPTVLAGTLLEILLRAGLIARLLALGPALLGSGLWSPLTLGCGLSGGGALLWRTLRASALLGLLRLLGRRSWAVISTRRAA